MYTFQEIVAKLSQFWHEQGCAILQPHDVEKGAATFNPHTFFRCLGPEPYHAAYIEPCRRPKDGRYAQNPNRVQHYFQYQVMLKPSPYNIQDLYLQSLEAIGFDLRNHDIRFVHDDWEQPTIGAWGLGWEIWIDGQECSQFTYFQAVGGSTLKPITGEITYGLERLAMYLQNKKSIFELQWNDTLTYGDIYTQDEKEWSRYNFEASDAPAWLSLFKLYENEAKRLAVSQLPIPALDFVMKASHAFNMLDARGAISVTERANYIAQVRDIAKLVADSYLMSRHALDYPLLHKQTTTISAYTPVPAADTVYQKQNSPQDLLLEIGVEELPASFVPIGLDNFERLMKELLEKEGLAYESIKPMGTPRRLTLLVKGVSPEKKASTQEKRGPSLQAAFDESGNATKALHGYCKQLGIEPPTKEQLTTQAISHIRIEEIKGTPYLVSHVHSESELTQTILEKALPALILRIDFPKKMRWADLDIGFARPIRWIACLYGEEVISFDVGPIHSSRYSFGHRQLAPHMIELTYANQYEEQMAKAHVVVCPQERVQLIQAHIRAIEETHNCIVSSQEKIIPQVVHLVEKPYLALTEFDEHYLRAPQEVLVSEMREHQKYFPVLDRDKKLRNQFVITANVPATAAIEQGNRNVLSARLSDGVFLYEQDLKTPLDGFVEKLKGIIFQSGFETGHDTLYHKSLRMQKEAAVVAPYVPGADVALTQQAALYAKADLATEVVQEFPELQGEMGRIYAQHQKMPQAVCQAIDEHWMPRGEKAPLPTIPEGIALGITEKIDNLISFFGLGLKPTSSSDPFALRRQALGLVKIVIKHKLTLPLRAPLKQCIAFFPHAFSAKSEILVQEIISFIQARMRPMLQEEGFSKNAIEACLSPHDDDIFDIFCRIEAVHRFQNENKDFEKLIEVYKRCRGQIADFPDCPINHTLFSTEQEKDLYRELASKKTLFMQKLSTRQYTEALSLVAELQPFLAELFLHVKILADDAEIKKNRIALLQQVLHLFDAIAQFGKL